MFDRFLLFLKSHWSMRVIGFTAGYAVWGMGFRLLILTFITYSLMTAPAVEQSGRLRDISELFSANEILIVGLSAVCFIILLRQLYPLTQTAVEEVFSPRRFETLFFPGVLQGAVLALGLTLAFLLSGYYRYLGFFIQPEDITWVLFSVLLRVGALGCMVYCEEYLLRHKILGYLKDKVPAFYAIIVVSLIYCCIKAMQFNLGVMHFFTLFLLSFVLGLRAKSSGDFVAGAGFLAGLLIVFHALLGFPIFGDEFSGIVLIKYQGSPSELFSMLEGGGDSIDSRTALFITGGIGGPLSSFALQFFLLLQIGYLLYPRRESR